MTAKRTLKTKHCPSCGITKLRDAFARNRSRRDGVQSTCKACRKHANSKNRLPDHIRHRPGRTEYARIPEYLKKPRPPAGRMAHCSACGRSLGSLSFYRCRKGRRYSPAFGRLATRCRTCAGRAARISNYQQRMRHVKYTDPGKAGEYMHRARRARRRAPVPTMQRVTNAQRALGWINYNDYDPNTEKRCKGCGLLCDLRDFHRRPGCRDGLSAYCIRCTRDRTDGAPPRREKVNTEPAVLVPSRVFEVALLGALQALTTNFKKNR